jgi:hypothetical protein
MGSIKSQIGQSEIFKNWRWTLVFSIWAGFSNRRKGLLAISFLQKPKIHPCFFGCFIRPKNWDDPRVIIIGLLFSGLKPPDHFPLSD